MFEQELGGVSEMWFDGADTGGAELWGSSDESFQIGSFTGKNPGLPVGAESWERLRGPLYGHELGAPQVEHIDQGDEGNCWLLATMAALAGSSALGQLSIQDLITEGKDGTYDVKLYNPDVRGGSMHGMKAGSTSVNVSPEFPVNEFGEWVAADPNPNDTTVLWPAIIEKAMAQMSQTGDYGGLYGSDPGLAMAALTGKRPKVWKDWAAGNLTEEEALALLSENATNPMVAGTVGATGQKLPAGLSGQHAYAVLGTEERDGQVYVKLYNPFGFADGDDSVPDGATPKSPFETVPLSDFVSQFKSLRVGHAAGVGLGEEMVEKQ